MEQKDVLDFEAPRIEPFITPESLISYGGLLNIAEQKNDSLPSLIKPENFQGNSDPEYEEYARYLGKIDNGDNIISLDLGYQNREGNKINPYVEFISEISQLNQSAEQKNKFIIKDLSAFSMGALANAIASPSSITPTMPLSGPNSSVTIPQPSSISSPIFYKLGRLKPEELPEIALPIVDFIEATQPHIVIGCDRGGRMMSIAVHSAWQQTKDGERFPTVDGKIHFARVSKSVDEAILQGDIDRIVEAAMKEAKIKGNEIGEDEQMRVLFIDDWVVGGGTKKLAHRLMKKHGAKTYFAVMSGDGADVSGDPDRGSGSVAWHDNPEHIGVNYLSSVVKNSDGSTTEKQVVVPVRTEEAASNRRAIHKAAKSLGKTSDDKKVS